LIDPQVFQSRPSSTFSHIPSIFDRIFQSIAERFFERFHFHRGLANNDGAIFQCGNELPTRRIEPFLGLF
jgi:hypothetical protein